MESSNLDLTVHEATSLPYDLIDIMYEYIPIRDLVELALTSLPQLPQTQPWKIKLKQYPAAYAQFKTKHILNVSTDEISIMIMAGLYRRKFGPPLSQSNLIKDDYNFKLYLLLTYYGYPDVDIQTLYNQVEIHMREHGFRESQLFFVKRGAKMNMNVFLELLYITQDKGRRRKLIRKGVKTYGSELLESRFGLPGEPRLSFYRYLIQHYPDLALTYIDLIPITWKDFSGFNYDVYKGTQALPDFDYTQLMNAYANRLGPIKPVNGRFPMRLYQRVPKPILNLLRQYVFEK